MLSAKISHRSQLYYLLIKLDKSFYPFFANPKINPNWYFVNINWSPTDVVIDWVCANRFRYIKMYCNRIGKFICTIQINYYPAV